MTGDPTPPPDFDYRRYTRLLAEANDEPKRLALINLLIEERAKDKLAAHLVRHRLEAPLGEVGTKGGGELATGGQLTPTERLKAMGAFMSASTMARGK
jgi:hypothetical protein